MPIRPGEAKKAVDPRLQALFDAIDDQLTDQGLIVTREKFSQYRPEIAPQVAHAYQSVGWAGTYVGNDGQYVAILRRRR